MFIAKYKSSIARLLVTGFSALALVFSFSPLALAADYNCAAYGAGDYGTGGSCTSTGPQSGGGLENTGQKVLAFGIPSLMIIAGTVILVRATRQKKHSNDQDS